MDKKMIFAAIGIVVFFGGLAVMAQSAGASSYTDSASPVMYFYSDTCSHCQAMKPILSNLAKKGFRVKPMDVRTNQAYWQQYSIEGTPTWIAANGDRIVGEQSQSYLEYWLEQHGAKIK